MVSERNHPQAEAMSYEQAAALYEKLEARAVALRSSHSRVVRTRLWPRRPRMLALALAACTSAAVVAAVMISSGGAHHPSAEGGKGHQPHVGSSGDGINGILPAAIGSNPFADGGRRITFGQASRLLGFQVPTPNAPLANPGNLTSIWFSPVGNGSGTRGEVMLDYVSTQIRISVMPANHILTSDARGAFKKEAKEVHMSPGVLTMDGAPGLADGGDPGNPGFAEIVRGGLDIAVMGHRSAADLITIARSLYSKPAN